MIKHKYTFIEGEVWKDIPDYEGYYQVSDMGRVRSIARTIPDGRGGTKSLPKRLLSPWKDEHGRRNVTLSKDGKRSQRRAYVLVLRAFVGPPPRTGLIRIDGNPGNDRLGNLAYRAESANIARGQRNGRAKISNTTAVKIHQRLKKGEKQVAIARALKVPYSIVNDIRRGKTWTHIK